MVTEAKNAPASFCLENMGVTSLTNQLIDYKFQPSQYVRNIVVSGDCDAPIIAMTNQGYGRSIRPG